MEKELNKAKSGSLLRLARPCPLTPRVYPRAGVISKSRDMRGAAAAVAAAEENEQLRVQVTELKKILREQMAAAVRRHPHTSLRRLIRALARARAARARARARVIVFLHRLEQRRRGHPRCGVGGGGDGAARQGRRGGGVARA